MNKSVIITDGTGTVDLINGSYDISSNVTGYDNTTINPQEITVDAATTNYAFTISATGTLTLHVTDTGLDTGTQVVGATFIRTDSEGNEYGTAITTDANGDAVFNNVPYATTDAPLIYYKQTASDGDHEFDSSVVSTTMTVQTTTLQIQNAKGAERTITLTDANYENLPVSGTIDITNN